MRLDNQNSLTTQPLISNSSERALLLCERARALEEAGEFEAARQEVAEFCQRVGDRPRIEGLDERARAEVLLRVGTLTGWIGSARQLAGSQELAKDLISESLGIFEKLGSSERVAEARIDMAICYWREGAFDEARITLDDALEKLGNIESEQRLRYVLNKAIVEQVSHRAGEAIRLLEASARIFDESNNHALRGKFHNELATVLKNVGLAEHREDYVDRALVEYTAASFHAEQAKNRRFLALVENNVGFLSVRLNRFSDAHEHLNRARAIFVALKDKGMVAQVDDTRAQALLAQGHYPAAERLARGSVRVLEEGDEHSLVAEALTTQGTALARLGRTDEAFRTLKRALHVAGEAGDSDSSGIAALTIVEELGTDIQSRDLLNYYFDAERLLSKSQHPRVSIRLGDCARRLLATQKLFVSESMAQQSSNGDSLEGATEWSEKVVDRKTPITRSLEAKVLSYEGDLIKRALEVSGGSVTSAARLLGTTHQGLAYILNGRQSNLLSARKPVKKRRRSIIRSR